MTYVCERYFIQKGTLNISVLSTPLIGVCTQLFMLGTLFYFISINNMMIISGNITTLWKKIIMSFSFIKINCSFAFNKSVEYLTIKCSYT